MLYTNKDIITNPLFQSSGPSVCRSGLQAPLAYSLFGGGVPIPEQRLCWTLDSVPFRFKNTTLFLL